MGHLRRRQRVAGYVICRPLRDKRIHHWEVDGIWVALIEAISQDDRGGD